MGLEYAYDFHEIMKTTNTLNHLVMIEYWTNGLKFDIVHNRMENVWADFYPLVAGESLCNLVTYVSIPIM